MGNVSRIGNPDLNAEIVLVFVHGLGGSANTWSSFTKQLSEKWEDNKTTPIDLLYPVYTPNEKDGFLKKVLFRGPDINRLSNFLKEYINVNCRKYKTIIIVAHSMGGLISRKYIVDNLQHEGFCSTDLITYATPHRGSLIATIACFFIFPLFIPQVRQLGLLSRFIRRLNIKWSESEAYEKINFITVAAGRDWIVKLWSSILKNEKDQTIREDSGKSHFTILEPNDKNDLSLGYLYNIIEDRINIILSGNEQVDTSEDDNTLDDYEKKPAY